MRIPVNIGVFGTVRRMRREVLFLLYVGFLYNNWRPYGPAGFYSLYGGILTTNRNRGSPFTCRYSIYNLYYGAAIIGYIRYRGVNISL
jgi:hypothetical protein